MKKLWILGLLLLPFAAGCSSLCFWRSTTTEVAVLDEDLAPVTNVKIKGKLVGEYVLVPREALDNTEPAEPRPAAARRPAARPAKAKPARTQDDKMRISWDGASRIRIRCQQQFGAADVFPGRRGDWNTEKPEVTADGFLDPTVIGPIIEEVRVRNQERLAKNPNLELDDLEKVCFNYHTPQGERFARHLTKDGEWARPTPSGADPGGRIVLDGVDIVEEIAERDENGHKAGDRINAFAVIPY